MRAAARRDRRRRGRPRRPAARLRRRRRRRPGRRRHQDLRARARDVAGQQQPRPARPDRAGAAPASTTARTASARPAGSPIGKARLQAFPRATLCVTCKQTRGAPLTASRPGPPTPGVDRPRGRPRPVDPAEAGVTAVVRRMLCSWRSRCGVVARPARARSWSSRAGPSARPERCSAACCTLTYTRNPGAAFSLGTGMTVVFTVVAVGGGRGDPAYRAPAAQPVAGRSRSACCSAARSATSSTGSSRDPGFLRGHVVDWIELPHFAGLQPRRLGDRLRRRSSSCCCRSRGIQVDGTHGDAAAIRRSRRTARRAVTDAAPCPSPTGWRASGSTPAWPACSGSPAPSAADLVAAGDVTRRRHGRRQVRPGQRRAPGSRSTLPGAGCRRGRGRARAGPRACAIVHDDDDIVVVDKPVGVAAHPSPGWTGPTVVGGLAAAGYRISTSGAAERQGVVHRLDVGTSGLMVVAKSERAYTALKRAFQERDGRQALPRPRAGPPRPAARHRRRADRPAPAATTTSGRWSPAASRASRTTTRSRRSARACLLEIHLETGRTHQIRVHMSRAAPPVRRRPAPTAPTRRWPRGSG